MRKFDITVSMTGETYENDADYVGGLVRRVYNRGCAHTFVGGHTEHLRIKEVKVTERRPKYTVETHGQQWVVVKHGVRTMSRSGSEEDARAICDALNAQEVK